MRPSEYEVQNGCWCCEHMVDNSDEESVRLYCGLWDMYVPEIPEYDEDSKDWDAWATDAREVRICGICPNFKRMKFALPY